MDIFYGDSGDYYLLISDENNDFDAFLKKYIFLAGKWAWLPRWRRRVSGLKTPRNHFKGGCLIKQAGINMHTIPEPLRLYHFEM